MTVFISFYAWPVRSSSTHTSDFNKCCVSVNVAYMLNDLHVFWVRIYFSSSGDISLLLNE